MAASPEAQTRPLGAGARIAGKLELLQCVAEGGMGAVWAARNAATGANVAVKVLHPGRQKDDHAAERFRHEAKLGATLAHRNITRVFDLLEEDDGSLILVMELLRGETLRDHYKAKGSLSTRDGVAIIVPILSALQHAHDHGVVHRDIKPTNIFLHIDPDGQITPKLLDFGIAKARDSSIETRTGDALGTPSYMSPEQVRAKELDGRSDLFSIAVVLYEILTGKNPFQSATPTAALAQVLELEIDPEPAIDPRVWLEINRALCKQAYGRHSSARDFASTLCAAVGESEAELAHSLRREDFPLTPPARFVDAAATPSDPAPVDAKIQTPALPTNGRRLRVVFGCAAAAMLLLSLGIFALRPEATAQTRTSADPPADSGPAPSLSESAPVKAAVTTTEPTGAPRAKASPPVSQDLRPGTAHAPPPRRPAKATVPATAPVASAKPAPSASVRPLARTPGF